MSINLAILAGVIVSAALIALLVGAGRGGLL